MRPRPACALPLGDATVDLSRDDVDGGSAALALVVLDHMIGAWWGRASILPDGFAKHKVSVETDVKRSNRSPDAVSTAAQPCDREIYVEGEECRPSPGRISARGGIDALCRTRSVGNCAADELAACLEASGFLSAPPGGSPPIALSSPGVLWCFAHRRFHT